MNLIEKLKNKDNFTAAETSLAEYILNNIENVHRMSLQDLAKASYVSKPSVIRLYRKVGCTNYREFSIALQLEKIRMDNQAPIENSSVFFETENNMELAEKICLISKQIVDNCLAAIERKSLDGIVEALYRAEKIYLYHLKNVEDEARTFVNRMSSINREPIVIDRNGDYQSQINAIGKNDAVIIVSFGELDTDDDILNMLGKSEAPRILVTTMNDPYYRVDSDFIFYTYPNGNDFIRNNEFVSRMSLLLGLNIIQSCLNKKAMKEVSAS